MKERNEAQLNTSGVKECTGHRDKDLDPATPPLQTKHTPRSRSEFTPEILLNTKSKIELQLLYR